MDSARTTARARRASRALRAGAASGVSTVIAATAHTLAGAGAPPWWLVLAVALLAWPAAVWLVGRRLTIAGTSAAVLVAQSLLHLAFAAVGTAAPQSPVPHVGHHAGQASLAVAEVGHLHLDLGMIIAHVLAAALTVAVLTRGERVLRRIARGVRRLLSRAAATPALPSVPLMRAFRTDVPAVRLFLSALSRRGPPAFAR